MNELFQWYIGLGTTLEINKVIIVQRLVPFANLLKMFFFPDIEIWFTWYYLLHISLTYGGIWPIHLYVSHNISVYLGHFSHYKINKGITTYVQNRLNKINREW